MSEQIKKRNPNCSTNEKSLLLHCVYDEREVVENKKTDASTWKDKESAWRRIEKNFNSQSGSSCFRSSHSLKRFYSNYKAETRKDAAQEKFVSVQTGGGKPFKSTDPNFDLAIAIMNPKTVHGLENEFDGDNEVDKQDENSDDNPSNSNDWSKYNPSMLRKGVHPKLKTLADSPSDKNESTPSEVDKEKPPQVVLSKGFKMQFDNTEKDSNTPWVTRRRPVASSLPSTKITEQYSELSRIKIELPKLQYETLKEEAIEKKYQRSIEHELKKKSMELDIDIKTEILKKIKKENCTAKQAQNAFNDIEVFFNEINEDELTKTI